MERLTANLAKATSSVLGLSRCHVDDATGDNEQWNKYRNENNED